MNDILNVPESYSVKIYVNNKLQNSVIQKVDNFEKRYFYTGEHLRWPELTNVIERHFEDGRFEITGIWENTYTVKYVIEVLTSG